jgi:uncharacterized protein (DUF1501 family)
MQRRDLLKTLAALPSAAWATKLYAAGSERRPRFLLLFLRGGYDCASLLVPFSSAYYYEARPNIAVARPGSDAQCALPLDSNWGLHPALRDSVYPLWEAGQLAFAPFAGSDDLSRSHFKTQDSIEFGQPLEGARDFNSGFMNRLASVLGASAEAISFTEQLPVVFRGPARVPNLALRNLTKPSLDARQSQSIAAMYSGTPLLEAVTGGFAIRADAAREMTKEMEAANRSAISSKGFELEARRIARLMRDKYALGFVDIGGWDTHIGQGGATGYLAGRLDELGRGLAAFAEEIGAQWRNTTVLVLSEFGRTFRENGNRGTDHGHGSVYWILGGSVHGGRIVGEQTRIEQANLFQNRDYPVLNDYRRLLSGLFVRLYGLGAAQIEQVFARSRPLDLALV